MSGVQTVNETPLQRHWRKKRELKQTKRETGLNNHKNNRTKAIFGDITNVQNTKVTPLKRVFRDIQNTVTQTQYICEMQPITEPKRKKRRRALRKKKQNQDTTVNISITKSNKPIHITQTKSKNNKVFSNSKKRIQKPKPTEIKKQFSKLSDTEKIVELQHRLRKKTLDLTKSKITIKKNNKLISTLTARSKDTEIAIKNNQQKAKQMELLLSLGSILGKMIISIAQIARQKNQKKPVVINQVDEEKKDNDINDPIDKLKNKNKAKIQNDKDNEEGYSPKAIYGILYPSRGFLEAHTDAHQGWIVSISVGAICDFWFSDQKKMDKQNTDDKNKHHIHIESGDVMVFPGYRLMHGVDNVDENVPRFWKLLQAKGVIPLQYARYCLQFRHPLK
eukprot:476902_1